MNIKRFENLARTGRVTLLTALDLLWRNGRAIIQTEDISALMAGCAAGIGSFCTAEKLHEVVTVCKELASLKTAELILYLRCEGMKMTDPGADEEGVCPICGGELEYGDDEPLDNGGVYEWTCLKCGATGREGYDKVFDRHYDVRDGDGNPYHNPPDGARNTALAVPETVECPLSSSAANGGGISTLPQADAGRLNVYFPQKDWNLYFWGFTCFSRQDYAGIVPLDGVDEIMLGVQCVEGGALGELAVRWHMLGGKPVPRLEVYGDAWQILQTPTFISVMGQLTQMRRNHEPTPDEVSALLIVHGFADQFDRPLGTANG